MAENQPDQRCCVAVYTPEELRMRRGIGFRRHYTRSQCTRKACEGGMCKQHFKVAQTRYLEVFKR